MALNPAFADASVNPSQSMGNDASVNPTQGALPTGAPATQNTGTTGLGQQGPMPQFDLGFTRWDPNDPKNQASYQAPQQDPYGFDSTGNYVGVNTPTGGFNPFGNRIDTPMQPDYIGQPATQEVPDYQMPMNNDQPFPQYDFGVPSPFMNQSPMQQPQAKPLQSFFEGSTKGQIPMGFSMVNGEMVRDPNYQAPSEQQPQVGGLQDPQTNPFLNPLSDFKNTEQWQRVAPNYAGLPQNVQDYVASQLSQGAMDGGTNWKYDPTAQTFSGTPNGLTPFGNNPTPEVKSLSQMTDYVNWINSPNASTTRPPSSWERPPIIQGSLGDLKTAAQTGTNTMATNPLSQLPVDPAAAYTPAPNVGTASSGGGSFTQGAPLPNITTTQQQVTAAPAFYTDYLNQLAKQGASTAQNAQYVGATDLQNQAFNQTAQNVGNYQPALQSAINMAQNVGDSNLYKAVGELGQANIARNLAPQATAGIVGSGQFGSKRGAAALGDTIANAELGITAQQAQALQQDMQNRIAAAQQLGNLASTTQQLGLGDINALATMGGQKQTIAQNEQLFPMQQLTNQSQLLRGYTIPTSTGSSYTGPIPGAYAASPLQQIAGLGALGAGISQTKLGDAIGNLISGTPAAAAAAKTGLANLFNIGSKSPNVTTPTTIGDVSASIKTLPDGTPNPNYDAYADPNATDADRLQQNLINTPVNPDIDNFDYNATTNDIPRDETYNSWFGD